MDKLLDLLALLVLRYPELKQDVTRMVKREGVSQEEWTERLKKLEKNSADYFGSTPPPIPHLFAYDAWLQSPPDDSLLMNGDHIYGQPKEAPSKWFVHQGGPLNFGMPGFPNAADLIRVVTK